MKTASRAFIASIAIAASLALPAYASASTWTKSAAKYTIYVNGGSSGTYLSAPVSVPSSGTAITNVHYSWTPYTNGNTSETVTVCYTPRFSSVEFPCDDVSTVQSDNTSAFNGLDARGVLTIHHTIFGGTYPALGGLGQDSVTVTYTP